MHKEVNMTIQARKELLGAYHAYVEKLDRDYLQELKAKRSINPGVFTSVGVTGLAKLNCVSGPPTPTLEGFMAYLESLGEN